MENAVSLPSTRFNADLVGDRHCYDAWRETLRPVYDVNPLIEGNSTTERLDAWLLDNLIFSEVKFSKQTFSHGAEFTQDANYLSLQIYKSGSSNGIVGDVDWRTKPGDVHIYDFSREFYSITDNSVVAGVTIPHAALGYDPGKHPPHMMFNGNSTIGRLLKNSVTLMQSQLPELKQEDAPELSRVFCGMLGGLIAPKAAKRNSNTTKSRAERHADMRAYLDRNLSDPTLGVDHLLRMFAVSRSVIYRDFVYLGGVAAYISKRRLDRAFHQLISASSSRTRVKDIAIQLGFQDPAYFSRLFRQRFGISPIGAMHGRKGPARFSAPANLDDDHQSVRELGNWFNTI